MDHLQWEQSLATGIPLIDNQHKTWFARFNELADAVSRHEGPMEISSTLSFLVDYTEYHFATEEQRMTANNYPGLAEHQQVHAELQKTLDNLVGDFFEEGATHELANYLDAFLRNWLTHHIREVDQQFAAYVREHGILIAGEA